MGAVDLQPGPDRGAHRRAPGVDALLVRSLGQMSSAISLIDVRDERHPIVYANAAFGQLTGYAGADAIGRPWTCTEGPETDPATMAAVQRAIAAGEEIRVRVRQHHRSGRPYWSETFLSPIAGDDGAITHFVAVQKDVTAQAEAQQRAAHLAYHDALTGLPNRTQLTEHLVMALARARRRGTALAVLFLDLDGFKPVNDRYGHDAGDQLLRAVAERWAGVARDGDLLARHGGDEFVLVMSDLDVAAPGEAAGAASARYAAALRDPFAVASRPGEPVGLGVSVGVALHPRDGHTAADLLMAADAAMYAAKERRRGDIRALAPR